MEWILRSWMFYFVQHVHRTRTFFSSGSGTYRVGQRHLWKFWPKNAAGAAAGPGASHESGLVCKYGLNKTRKRKPNIELYVHLFFQPGTFCSDSYRRLAFVRAQAITTAPTVCAIPLTCARTGISSGMLSAESPLLVLLRLLAPQLIVDLKSL